MRCRHCDALWETEWEYCPECHRNYGGAVYPKQQTTEESADGQRLIALIAEAFRDVRLDDGTTIHEADLEGAYIDDNVRVSARAKDTEVAWIEVPDWKIERFSSALSFLDPKGWRFYIPAYMIWTLKNWRTTSSPTADFVVWGFEPVVEELSIPRFASLSLQQAHAVHGFLKFFCEYSGDPESRRAMRAYWHRFSPSTA